VNALKPQHIIARAYIKRGDAATLFRAMCELAGTASLPRSDKALIRSLERAHGLVVEAAERVNRQAEPDAKALRLLDVALVSYQRRVLLLCVNRKKVSR